MRIFPILFLFACATDDVIILAASDGEPTVQRDNPEDWRGLDLTLHVEDVTMTPTTFVMPDMLVRTADVGAVYEVDRIDVTLTEVRGQDWIFFDDATLALGQLGTYEAESAVCDEVCMLRWSIAPRDMVDVVLGASLDVQLDLTAAEEGLDALALEDSVPDLVTVTVTVHYASDLNGETHVTTTTPMLTLTPDE